jgi:hypothetical protein
MTLVRGIALSAALAVLSAASTSGQDQKPPQAGPSDEHAYLHQFVGEWRTTGKGTDPSGKDKDLTGFEFDRMVLNDYWLFFVYNTQTDGKPYVGHGMIGYDPVRKKYIGTWVDSMTPYMATFDGSADRKQKTLTMEVSGTDSNTGKSCKGRLVFEFADPEHRSLKSYKIGDNGEATLSFELHYTKEPPPQAPSK